MTLLLLTVAVAVCHIVYALEYAMTGNVLETLKDVTGHDAIRHKEGFEYMRQFGYLNRHPKAMTWADYKVSMMKMQKMMAVPQTGIADDATYEMMYKARCGTPDGHVYSLEDDRDWEEEKEDMTGGLPVVLIPAFRDITYKVTGYLANNVKVTPDVFDKYVWNAYKKWSAVTTLTFTPTKCEAMDMEIYFGSGAHRSCDTPFTSLTLAHALGPNLMRGWFLGEYGDSHFNQDRAWDWVDNTQNTATHEFGHALGLRHSSYTTAIMYPYPISGVVDLGGDDIYEIQERYGDANTPYGNASPLDPACVDTAKQY